MSKSKTFPNKLERVIGRYDDGCDLSRFADLSSGKIVPDSHCCGT